MINKFKDLKRRNQILVLYEKQSKKCYYCRTKLLKEAKEDRSPLLDHYIPKSKGGGQGKNLVLACSWCDTTKSASSPKYFIKFLEPYNNGKVERKEDLYEYWTYLKLRKKYGR